LVFFLILQSHDWIIRYAS